MLQAMNTGHDGSLSTIHANSSRDALSRVETMFMMAGYDMPVRAIRQQVASALDLLIHVERMMDGSRKVTSITEVQRMESEMIALQDIFEFRMDGVPGSSAGRLTPTGLRPSFTAKFQRHDVEMPAWISAGMPAPAPPTAAVGSPWRAAQ
jgi:pilus assembly protein CpaF